MNQVLFIILVNLLCASNQSYIPNAGNKFIQKLTMRNRMTTEAARSGRRNEANSLLVRPKFLFASVSTSKPGSRNWQPATNSGDDHLWRSFREFETQFAETGDIPVIFSADPYNFDYDNDWNALKLYRRYAAKAKKSSSIPRYFTASSNFFPNNDHDDDDVYFTTLSGHGSKVPVYPPINRDKLYADAHLIYLKDFIHG